MEQNHDELQSYESPEQFWNGLDQTIGSPHTKTEEVDAVLKNYLRLIAEYQVEANYTWGWRTPPDQLTSEYDWTKCCYRLLESELYRDHERYARRRIIGRLKKEVANSKVYLAASILLYDGRRNERTFEVMQAEGVFPRLLSLIMEKKEDEGLRYRLLELAFEMSRIQKLRYEDLKSVDDRFISHMFETVEEDADVNDPYHYVAIRVLLVLNEQYMISQVSCATSSDSANEEPLTNKVIKTLCLKGDVYKTFGENIILLLNREIETRSQLLILKLLYLLFTTSATYEYFYLNDLHVLVDVIIRNLLDLPEDAVSLRHTYLRVLYPLLIHSQLRNPPHYKCGELVSLFKTLANAGSYHFQPPDTTTLRLVARCSSVAWLEFPEETKLEPSVQADGGETSPTVSTSTDATDPRDQQNDALSDSESGEASTRYLRVPLRKALGMSLDVAQSSSVEVAALMAKPGIQAPSRSRASSNANRNDMEQLEQSPEDLCSMVTSTNLRPLPSLPTNHTHHDVHDNVVRTPPPPPPPPITYIGCHSYPNNANHHPLHPHLPPPPPLPRGVRRASASSVSTSKSASPPPQPPPPPPPRRNWRHLQQQEAKPTRDDTVTPSPLPPPPEPRRRPSPAAGMIAGEA